MPDRLSKSKIKFPKSQTNQSSRLSKTSEANLSSQSRTQGWLKWSNGWLNWLPFLSKTEITKEKPQTPTKAKINLNSKKLVFPQPVSTRQPNKAEDKIRVFVPNLAKLTNTSARFPNQADVNTSAKSLCFLKNNWLSGLEKTVSSWKIGWIQTQLLQRVHRIVVRLLILASIGFIVYLTLFDTYFLVKKYEIVFAKNSYLDSQNVQKIITTFQQQKFLGILPNNQFWFINELSLYHLAREVNSEVTQVKILSRTWPNQVKLEITTKPILVTLGLNNGQEYWRVGQTGRIVSKDEANLRENLVVVEYPVVLTVSGQVGTPQRISFANYSFEQRPNQLNRFWYIIWLWNELDKLQVKVVSTAVPSLSDLDSNVIITTSNNTKLYFDVNTGDATNQARRLKFIFESSTLADKEAKGELAYIDFRFPKRIFVCHKGAKCDTQ